MKKQLLFLIVSLTVFSSQLDAQSLSKKQLKKMNKATSSIFKGQCPLERIEWMEVSEKFDRKNLIDIATKIQAAAKADAEKIKNIAEGNASVELSGDFKRTIDKITEKKVKVSQEFFEQYQMLRAPICNIYQSVQTGFYKDNPEALKTAQLKFIVMNDSWLKYIQDEEKKNRP